MRHYTSGEIYSGTEIAQMVRELIPGADIQIGNALNEAEKIDAAKRGKLDLSLAKMELRYEPMFKLPEAVQDYLRMFREYRLQIA